MTTRDNALAETTIGLCKSECARDGSPFRDGPLDALGQVDKITSDWVHWYNNDRPMHRTGLAAPRRGRRGLLGHPEGGIEPRRRGRPA